MTATDPRAFWSDGQAELDGYHLVRERYGQVRKGRLVLIFVKEPFSESARVKADPGKHPPEDVFDVLKLNAVEQFQTGIYDYGLMTSAFSAFDARSGRRAGALTKLAFSCQEWCGLMFEEILFDAAGARRRRFSYFDGEGDQLESLDLPRDLVAIDELPILVRSIPGSFLAPGESKTVKLMPSLRDTRLLHRPLAIAGGTLARGKDAVRLDVPAGRFETETWTVTLEGGEQIRFAVERAEPRRLIAISGPGRYEAKLAGSARLKYWELNQNGNEKLLEKLGVTAPRLVP